MNPPGGEPSGRTISFDMWAVRMAQTAALWSECKTVQVGAVIVSHRPARRIIATGVNGSPPGGRTCLQGACPRAAARERGEVAPLSSYDTGPGACIAIHAEMNAIAQCAQHTGGTLGATLYVTYEPCPGCWRLIRASGLEQVVWPNSEGWLVRRFRQSQDFENAGKVAV